jgi:hypothetical protein
MRTNQSVTRCVCIGVCILALILSSGCFGKCVLSKGVSEWHAGLQWDKYSKEALFVPLFFFVLPFTSLVDYFIVNSIAYWSTEGDPLTTAGLAPADGADKPRIAGTEADLEEAPWQMAIESNRAVLEDRSGCVVAELRRLEDGSVILTDLNSGGAERRIAPEELAARGRR